MLTMTTPPRQTRAQVAFSGVRISLSITAENIVTAITSVHLLKIDNNVFIHNGIRVDPYLYLVSTETHIVMATVQT